MKERMNAREGGRCGYLWAKDGIIKRAKGQPVRCAVAVATSPECKAIAIARHGCIRMMGVPVPIYSVMGTSVACESRFYYSQIQIQLTVMQPDALYTQSFGGKSCPLWKNNGQLPTILGQPYVKMYSLHTSVSLIHPT